MAYNFWSEGAEQDTEEVVSSVKGLDNEVTKF